MSTNYNSDGRPVCRDYLECALPGFLAHSLSVFREAEKKEESGEKVWLLDCYYCELQSDINSAEVNRMISEEQAWYLREKYLGLCRE